MPAPDQRVRMYRRQRNWVLGVALLLFTLGLIASSLGTATQGISLSAALLSASVSLAIVGAFLHGLSHWKPGEF